MHYQCESVHFSMKWKLVFEENRQENRPERKNERAVTNAWRFEKQEKAAAPKRRKY